LAGADGCSGEVPGFFFAGAVNILFSLKLVGLSQLRLQKTSPADSTERRAPLPDF